MFLARVECPVVVEVLDLDPVRARVQPGAHRLVVDVTSDEVQKGSFAFEVATKPVEDLRDDDRVALDAQAVR